jgi:hypothetical protein
MSLSPKDLAARPSGGGRTCSDTGLEAAQSLMEEYLRRSWSRRILSASHQHSAAAEIDAVNESEELAVTDADAPTSNLMVRFMPSCASSSPRTSSGGSLARGRTTPGGGPESLRRESRLPDRRCPFQPTAVRARSIRRRRRLRIMHRDRHRPDRTTRSGDIRCLRFGCRCHQRWLPPPDFGVLPTASRPRSARLQPRDRRPHSCRTGRGMPHIVLAAGGSASTDGGSGCLRTRRSASTRVSPRRRSRDPGRWRFHRIDYRPLRPLTPEGRRSSCSPVMYNPLLGAHGVATVFGPQRGAPPRRNPVPRSWAHHFVSVLGETIGARADLMPRTRLARCRGVGYAAPRRPSELSVEPASTLSRVHRAGG